MGPLAPLLRVAGFHGGVLIHPGHTARTRGNIGGAGTSFNFFRMVGLHDPRSPLPWTTQTGMAHMLLQHPCCFVTDLATNLRNVVLVKQCITLRGTVPRTKSAAARPNN